VEKSCWLAPSWLLSWDSTARPMVDLDAQFGTILSRRSNFIKIKNKKEKKKK